MQSCGEVIIYHGLPRLWCEEWVQLETANLYCLREKRKQEKRLMLLTLDKAFSCEMSHSSKPNQPVMP